MKRKISLNHAVLIQLVMVGAVSVLLTGYLWISSELSKFEKEVAAQRGEYINAQKDTLKREVDHALAFVDYIRSQTDFEMDVQKESIKWISNIRFGKDGYVFAGQCDGISLSGPATGKNMYSVEDINGVKIVQELIEAAKSGGGFVHYVLPKFEGRKHAPKISYAAGIKDWQWYVGSGVYVDEIEDVIASKRSALHERIKKNVQDIFFILISLSVFILVFVKILSNRIRNNLTLFIQFFNRASDEMVEINRDELNFLEFDQLAVPANKMVEKQKQTERALQASHKTFLTVLDGIDATIYVADIKTHEILFMNKHMKESFGGDLTGRLCWDVFRSESGPCPHCSTERLLDEAGRMTEGHVWQGENPITKKWYINYDRAIEWTDGRVAKLQIATDITKFKKMEDELRQAHKMESIGTLAGGIAHDFNNILFPVLGYTEMLLDDTPDDSPTHQGLKKIYVSAIRARELVKQILTFSRQDTSELKRMKIQPIVKEALKLIRSTIPATIEIKQDINPDCGGIEADPTQIHQILMNLTTNAYHAMKDTGGQLIVSLKEIKLDDPEELSPDMAPGVYACLSVIDTGIGMDKELSAKIFDPFFTTKEQGKGTGMGLSVVHGIVAGMRGTIRVDSVPGEGTNIHIYFPVVENFFENQETQAKKPIPEGSGHILLVDDEEEILAMERQMLRRLGYQVTSFNNSPEALEVFRLNPDKFDLVITDMAMPKMSGDKLSMEIKKIRFDIPVLLCTGFSETLSEEKAASLGINGFLIKPIMMADFAQKIRDILDN